VTQGIGGCDIAEGAGVAWVAEGSGMLKGVACWGGGDITRPRDQRETKAYQISIIIRMIIK
jgi:hypothetical protein